MKTVWKYPIAFDARVAVDLPEGAQILLVDMQGDTLCLWALVDPAAHSVPRTLLVAGTGHPIGEESVQYISSFYMYWQTLVFHVFEVLP